MAKHLWTVEQCREMGRKSAERRAQLKANPPATQEIEPQPIQLISPSTEQPTDNGYASKLAYAQDCLLDQLLAAESPKDKAALSQALKNLRETYHMATGAPKPGTIKPERVSSRQQVKQPSEPKLDTTGSGPTG